MISRIGGLLFALSFWIAVGAATTISLQTNANNSAPINSPQTQIQSR